MALNDFYKRMQQTATSLIEQYGTDGVLVRQSETADSSQPWKKTKSDTNLPCVAVCLSLFPGATRDFFAQKLDDGTTVEAGDRLFYVSGQAPKLTDLFRWPAGESAQDDYRVKHVQPVDPAGDALMWSMVCTKS